MSEIASRRIFVNATATAGLAAAFVGLWWERPSLALILVGGLVFVAAARVYLADYRASANKSEGELR